MTMISGAALFAVLTILCTVSFSEAGRKNPKSFWPSPPFVDGCDGTPEARCLRISHCGWFETYIPWCYDKRYIKVKPLPVAYPQADLAKRFFVYSNGVHLSEGTNQKIYYNTNHEECATLCINSPNEPLNVRCLSFDFYEFPSFELPEEQPEPPRGVCVLNDNSNDNARLRNVDQGYTDEELYADPPNAGHYRLRLSNYAGNYAVRNPRGGQLAQQLDYPVVSPDDLNKIYLWAKSRWGIAHIPAWENNPIKPLPNNRQSLTLDCSVNGFPPAPPNTTQLTYYGGFTPVDNNQKCVGKLFKAQAAQACADSGGALCPTQAIAKSLEGRKLGCSYDKDPVWSAADVQNPGVKRFVRCCAKYSYPNFCSTQYSADNINFCSKFKTFKDCQAQGTGYYKQNQWGFGRQLQSYRQGCMSDPSKCSKTLVQDWQPRDKCIWCLEPGTGRGQCRAGADLGICQSSSPEAQNRFTNIINVMCGPEATCRMAKAYPDLACFLTGQCSAVSPDPNVIPCASYSASQQLCQSFPDDCEWIEATKRCLSKSADDGA